MMLLQMNFKKTSATFFMAFCVFIFSQQSTQAADEYSVNTENTENKEKKELVNSNSASDRPLAIIRRFNPDVFVRGSNSSEWANATNAQPLFNADSLVTSDSGFAMIQFMDNSIVRMRPSSLLVIGGESRTRESTVTRLTMSAGEIFVSVTGIGESTEVVTPSAVAAVRGTNFAVLLSGNNKKRDDYFNNMGEPSEEGSTANGIGSEMQGSDFEVILISAGGEKLNVIKEIMALMGTTEEQAEQWVNNTPSVIQARVNKEEANQLKAALEAVGATVDLKRAPEGNDDPTNEPSDSDDSITGMQGSDFEVILISAGGEKLNVIKEIMVLMGTTEEQAEQWVNNTPSVIQARVNKEEANQLKAALEAVGATVDLKRAPEGNDDPIDEFFTSDESGNTMIIGFDGEVEVFPKEGEDSFTISGGDVILVNQIGTVFQYELTDEELENLLNMYTDDEPTETQMRTRTLELRFVNDAGEVEIITIEIEEPVENED